jgi:hypothetical protein
LMNPGETIRHARMGELYPGQTSTGTSSGFYVQQSGISVQ